MKKSKVIALIAIVVVVLGILFTWVFLNFIDIEGSHKRDKSMITKIVNKEFPDYEISNIELQYTNGINAEEGKKHRAIYAEVDIKNDDSKYLTFSKTILGTWKYSGISYKTFWD